MDRTRVQILKLLMIGRILTDRHLPHRKVSVGFKRHGWRQR
jgi:hypothetical protein